MEHIRIENTDVIFQEFGDGKGKIIISNDDYGYNFSYYWGAMGKDTSLAQFVQSINSDYFINKLSSSRKGDFDAYSTFVNLRRYIQECFEYELPWYDHMEFQKDYRKKLKEFQKTIASEKSFIDHITSFHNSLDYYLIKDSRERERVENLFRDIFSDCEPWHFTECEPHPETIFLKKLHVKLKRVLSKPVQLCLF